jgi:hypothetical protein
MLDEIGKRHDTVQLAREDRRCLEPPLDPRQLAPECPSDRMRATTTALPPREKLTGAFTCSDLRASLGLAIAPDALSGAGGSVELASRGPLSSLDAHRRAGRCFPPQRGRSGTLRPLPAREQQPSPSVTT